MTDSLKAFLSGGFGGTCLVFVGHPLDTIKVRLQTSNEYSGMMDCARKTVAKDGFRGLYRGMAAPIIGVTPIFAVYFLGFDWGKSIAKLVEKKDQVSTAGIIFAGGFSALPGTAVMVPGERIKVLLQIQGQSTAPPKYNGMLDCAKKVIAEEGVFRGLYKGSGATLLRDVPGSMAYYGAYELLKRKITPENGTPGAAAVLTCGGLAGCANWIVSVPPDVLKSRYQTAPPDRYPGGLKQVLSELLKNEGAGALYKGLGPAMLRAFPANAACFLGMETSRKFLDTLF